MIVILAMVAVFLGLRLYAVLGKRTGHEQLPAASSPAEDRSARPQLQPRPPQGAVVDLVPPGDPLVMREAEAGIREIIAADRSFDVGHFIDGTKAAYGMILDAFWKGNRADLHWLCDGDVATSFETAIDAREAAGQVLENRLVRIDRCQIVEAVRRGRVVHITVRIDADIAAVTRNAEGAAVAGSLSDAVPTHDLWTFSREIGQSSPNWKLSETDEAA